MLRVQRHWTAFTGVWGPIGGADAPPYPKELSRSCILLRENGYRACIIDRITRKLTCSSYGLPKPQGPLGYFHF
jgi:hypothetical protein